MIPSSTCKSWAKLPHLGTAETLFVRTQWPSLGSCPVSSWMCEGIGSCPTMVQCSTRPWAELSHRWRATHQRWGPCRPSSGHRPMAVPWCHHWDNAQSLWALAARRRWQNFQSWPRLECSSVPRDDTSRSARAMVSTGCLHSCRATGYHWQHLPWSCHKWHHGSLSKRPPWHC